MDRGSSTNLTIRDKGKQKQEGDPFMNRAKQRGRDDDEMDQPQGVRKKAKFRAATPQDWTVTVALPTSLITDCTTREKMTTMVGRLGRALAMFSVDELVIFDDSPVDTRPANVDEAAFTGDTDPAHFMEHLFSYMETPPFMRHTYFKMHPNLRWQGLLPNLDMPHHHHRNDPIPYREGIVLDERPASGTGTVVMIDTDVKVTIPDTGLPNLARITLKMSDDTKVAPEMVHGRAPRTEGGYYWGFQVRKAKSISDVFTSSPYDDGYDISIGTSERGVPLSKEFPIHKDTPSFSHMVIFFGGPRGLEYALINDPDLNGPDRSNVRPRDLFDHWINVLPGQGTRSIRTDEAVFVGLSSLRRLWESS